MHNLLGLESKHCCVAGNFYPILEQMFLRVTVWVQEGQSQPALFVPRGRGRCANRTRLDVPSGELPFVPPGRGLSRWLLRALTRGAVDRRQFRRGLGRWISIA